MASLTIPDEFAAGFNPWMTPRTTRCGRSITVSSTGIRV